MLAEWKINMKQRMTITIVTLALAITVWQVFRMYRAGTTPETGSAGMRVAAFNQQVQAFAAVDAKRILYHETATFRLPGLPSLGAIAVDTNDRIYAGGGRELIVLTSQGTELRRMELAGDITCLTLDEHNNLYVGFGNAVHAYDATGRETATFAGILPESIITSLAAGGGNVFVADAGRHAVLRFTTDGTLKQTIDGENGNGAESGFIVPGPYFDVALGQGQTLWIVNPGRHRLEEYNFRGERINAWQREAGLDVESFCGCCNPSHIARLSNGNLVTSEKGIPRVKVYTRRGVFVGVVAAPDQFDRDTPDLDLAVDSRDRVLVADPARNQVRVFERQDAVTGAE